MKQIVVVGGGPAGMTAAISAARAGARVTLLESGQKAGSKLLLTGNGRCNLTNLDFDPRRDYASSDPENAGRILSSVFRQMSVGDTLSFFSSMGLMTAAEHGTYVYPVTGQSLSVLNVLVREMERLRVRVKFREKVTGLERTEEGWLVRTGSWSYPCERVILACGSKCMPATGSDGNGYQLAASCGLRLTPVLPSLSAIVCRVPPFWASASGVRVRACVTASAGGREIASDTGQLQITGQGVSGIVVFQVSRMVTRALAEKKNVLLSLNLLPDMETDQIAAQLQRLKRTFESLSAAKLLEGFLPQKLIPALLNAVSIKSGTACGALSDRQAEQIAVQIRGFSLEAVSVRGFDNCQVCAGGVALKQLEPESLACTLPDCEGLYITGEMADIDGLCGGYNLQWAWSSGYVAGMHAALDGPDPRPEA